MPLKKFYLSRSQVMRIGIILTGGTFQGGIEISEIAGRGELGYALIIDSDKLDIKDRSEKGGKKEIEEKIVKALEGEGFDKFWRKPEHNSIILSSGNVPGVALEVSYSQKAGALIELKKP
jgi:hypothetical protein